MVLYAAILLVMCSEIISYAITSEDDTERIDLNGTLFNDTQINNRDFGNGNIDKIIYVNEPLLNDTDISWQILNRTGYGSYGLNFTKDIKLFKPLSDTNGKKESQNGSDIVEVDTSVSQMNNSEYLSEMFLFDNGYPAFGAIPVLNRQVFLGRRALINEHPYVVSIRRKFAHYLTGTLLTRNVVVTVAHPLYEVPVYQLGVVVGQSYADRGPIINTVLLVIMHNDFDPYTLHADLALLRIYDDMHLRVSVKAITVSVSHEDQSGSTAFVTGWGRCDRTGKELCLPRSSVYYRNEILDPMLRTVSFTIENPNSYCEEYSARGTPLADGMICLGVARAQDPMAPCIAVPGAPLVIDGLLVAIQSWGFGCSYIHDLPLVYTYLKYFDKWLNINVPFLNALTQEVLSDLFVANRAYVMSKYLQKTKLPTPVEHLYVGDVLVPLAVDRILALLEGNVTDIRDYVFNKTYRESKNNILRTLRKLYTITTSEVMKVTDNTTHVPDYIDNDNLTVVPDFHDDKQKNSDLEKHSANETDDDTDEDYLYMEKMVQEYFNVIAKDKTSKNASET